MLLLIVLASCRRAFAELSSEGEERKGLSFSCLLRFDISLDALRSLFFPFRAGFENEMARWGGYAQWKRKGKLTVSRLGDQDGEISW